MKLLNICIFAVLFLALLLSKVDSSTKMSGNTTSLNEKKDCCELGDGVNGGGGGGGGSNPDSGSSGEDCNASCRGDDDCDNSGDTGARNGYGRGSKEEGGRPGGGGGGGGGSSGYGGGFGYGGGSDNGGGGGGGGGGSGSGSGGGGFGWGGDHGR